MTQLTLAQRALWLRATGLHARHLEGGIGAADGLTAIWKRAWGLSWLIAFSTTLVGLPLVRKVTASIGEAP